MTNTVCPERRINERRGRFDPEAPKPVMREAQNRRSLPVHPQAGTPRTDAFYAAKYSPDIPEEMLEAVIGEEREFANSLERENIALREELRKMKGEE